MPMMTNRRMARAVPGMAKLSAAVCLAVAVLTSSLPAAAEQPSLVVATAPLVTPAAALTYYGSPASPAPPATRDPLIQEQARALRYDVDKIFAFVRDNVETIPIFGVQQGARGVVLNGRGTAFDQAQFLVEALREADSLSGTGYAPQYVLGQVTISGANFTSWFDVSTGAAASRLLAAGGIPASVSGTGTSYTVTMLHIWVRATIGGTAYLFDPAFKTYTSRAGTSWQSSVGYSRTNLLAAGGGGSATSVSNFNQAAFRATLDGYRANAEANLSTNGSGKRADAILGARDIVPHPAGEDRRTALPYVTSSDRTWTGQIPNAFRASFTVALNGTSYGTYFADTVGGSPLGFSYTYSNGNFVPATGIAASPQLLGSTTYDCDQHLGSQDAAGPAVATITINHPYAANAGAYGDRTLSKRLVGQVCAGGITGGGRFYVTNDWGYTGSGVVDRVRIPASRQRTEPANKLTLIFGPTLANVARQYSEFLDLARWSQGHSYLLHDLLGLHNLDAVQNKLAGGITTYDAATSLTMDFEGAVSAISDSGTVADDTTAAFTAGLGLPLVEGSVPRQETDAVYDMAALSLLTQQATRTNPVDASAPVYLATPATWGSVQANLTGYSSGALSAIQAYITEGYSVLVPKHGDLREPPITVTGTTTRTMSLWEGHDHEAGGVEVERSAFLAWRPTSGTNTVPDRVAMLVYDPRHGRVIKAGVGVAIDSVEGSIRKPEAPKAESKDVIRAAINVDGKTGRLRYSPAPDLVDGVAEFPFSLTLQRAFDQGDAENYGMGIGWKNSWHQMAALSNDGNSALGDGGAQALGPALVMITALGDLVQTPDAQQLHAAAQVATWFADQTINNAAVISSGLDGERTYYRQANGSFAPASADGTRLVQTGAPIAGIINRRLYHPVALTLTDRDGSVRRYPSRSVSAGFDISSPPIASLYSNKSLPMDRWSFPNGIVVTTSYFDTLATSDIVGVNTVANNLGSSIAMTFYDNGAATRFARCKYISPLHYEVEWVEQRPARIGYTTSSGAAVSIVMDAQSGQTNPGPDPVSCNSQGTLLNQEGNPVSLQASDQSSYAQSFTDAVGKIWIYGRGTASGLYGAYSTLTSFYKPGLGTPDVILTQGVDYNVRSLADAAANVWSFHSSPFRSEILSPLQALATPKNGDVTLYDRYGQPVAEIDALGRRTSTLFDDLGRVTQRTRPGGDSVLTGYDARGNVVTSKRRPTGGTGPTDIVTTMTYVVGPNVATCPAPEAMCNKPLTEVNGRGLVTNYLWNTDGTLQSVTRPADPANVQPQISLTYSTGLTGTDGTPLKLLTGKTEKISGTVSTTTTYTRSAANKYTVTAATVDAGTGKLNLRTCTKFDGAGNLISLSDPRQGVCP